MRRACSWWTSRGRRRANQWVARRPHSSPDLPTKARSAPTHIPCIHSPKRRLDSCPECSTSALQTSAQNRNRKVKIRDGSIPSGFALRNLIPNPSKRCFVPHSTLKHVGQVSHENSVFALRAVGQNCASRRSQFPPRAMCKWRRFPLQQTPSAMTSKLDKLRAQHRALGAAIKTAEKAERAAFLTAQHRAISRAVDRAISGGASSSEIAAVLGALRAPKLAQPMPETSVVNHG